MQFKYKIAAAFVVIVFLIGVVYAIQHIYLNREVSTGQGEYRLDETFTAEDFTYGPQAWAPYASKMPLIPGANVDGDEGFYLMFVDLNATSNLKSTFPRVQVDYAFTGLHGTAAFHVYGYIHSVGGAVSWTNRIEGSGASGYYVTTDQQSTSSLAGAQVMGDFNHVSIKVANDAGASFNANGDDTYFMRFEKEGGGLNTLHITTDPQVPTGQVTNTSDSAGTFYVTFTGDRIQDTFILLVAVNGRIGEDFGLNLKVSVPQ
jgi:hypothetical protein